MIALNKYQLAEREIRLLYFRYKDLSIAKLMKTPLISDIDSYLKKWSRKISAVRVNEDNLKNEIAEHNKTASQKEIITIYKEYLKLIFRTVVTVNVLSINAMADRICSKIVDGVDKYYYNHYYCEEREYDY